MPKPAHPTVDQIQLTDVLYALSDPLRLAIVRCLAEGRPLTCGQITLDRPKSSMSHHFKILREAGVIETRVEGKEHFNTLRLAELDRKFPGLMRTLLRAMAAD